MTRQPSENNGEHFEPKRIKETGVGPWEDPQGLVLSLKCEGEAAPRYFLMHTLEAPVMALALLDRAQKNAAGLPAGLIEADLEQKFRMASMYPLQVLDFMVLGDGYCLLNLGFCTLTIKMGPELQAKLKDLEPDPAGLE